MGREHAVGARTWMRFAGVMMMIFGGLYCLTIIGIVVGWLPILLGWLTHKAGTELGRYAESSDPHALESALGSLKTYYLIVGILLILYLVLVVLVALLYLIMGASLLALMGAAAASSP